MQIFKFCDGHVTIFWHPSVLHEPISDLPNAWSQILQTSKRHTGVSAFHQYHWFGVKLFPVGYAQDSRRYPKNTKNCSFGFFDLTPPTL